MDRQDEKAAVDEYYRLVDGIRKSAGKAEKLELCERSFALLEALSAEWYRDNGRFDIKSIPAIENACYYWSDDGEVQKLLDLQALVKTIRGLRPWRAEITNALENARKNSAAKAEERESD